jgi:tetratricopeptide (TPR) repeat protein
MKNSMRLFTLSQEQLKKGKVQKAITSMEKALRLHADPGYEYIRAILYLINRETEEALKQIRDVRKKYVFSPVKETALQLWEARCLDLLGRRREARRCYRAILHSAGLVNNIRKAVKKSLRSRFTYTQLPGSFNFNFLGPLDFA